MRVLNKLRTQQFVRENPDGSQEWKEVEVKIGQKAIENMSPLADSTTNDYKNLVKTMTNISPLADKTTDMYKEAANSLDGAAGLPFKFDIEVGGQSDRYYPVYIPHKAGINSVTLTELAIYRMYNEKAPGDWNTSTHQGGLNIKITYSAGAWGGFPQILQYDIEKHTYAPQFAGARIVDNGHSLCIWLRGGGAIYHLASSQRMGGAPSYIQYKEPTVFLTAGVATFISEGSTTLYSPGYRTRTVAEINEIERSTVSPVSTIIDTIYPVGAIYMSAVATSPATLFGGSWTALPAGRALVSIDTDQAEFNTVLKTGGSKTQALSTANLPAHAHTASSNSTGAHTHTTSGTAASNGAHTHTTSGKAASNGAHSHSNSSLVGSSGGQYKSANGTYYSFGYGGSTASAGAHSHNVSGTAASAGAHSHNVSGTAASAGNHSHTITVNNTGSGTAHNNLQPYVTLYMWRRTA